MREPASIKPTTALVDTMIAHVCHDVLDYDDRTRLFGEPLGSLPLSLEELGIGE